ncbi:MAG: HAD family hydrolase [Bacteroidales bacterium]|nr:HAD family hydrolase [Bacteroidales bacterium]
MHTKIHNILFDLDGTLTDPKEGIVNSILYALEKLGIQENHINELDTFIGPPLRGSFIARYNLSDNLADKAVTFYREYFSEKGLYENQVYPGVAELLEFLVSRKYQLFVATSKPTVYSDKILRHFNLHKYFTGIVGSNLDNTRTDKSEVIAHVVSTYSLQPVNSIMVGDRKHDIIGAKNNSMRSIAVTYGYGSLEEILSENPDFIVNCCIELKSLFLN